MPPQDIPLALVGCDFRMASSRWRSRLVLDGEEARHMAIELEQAGWAQGIVDLNTCNRNEWIISSTTPRWSAELLRTRMMERLGPQGSARVSPMVLVGEDAVRHIFRVALGQESLVLGERQIATQLFRAFETARTRGSSCRILNGLGTVAGRLVRIAIRQGCVGSHARGVHSLAVSYLRAHLARGTVVLVGLGSIGRQVGAILVQDPAYNLVRCNRTLPPRNREGIRPIDELPNLLSRADAVIVCTAAPEPIIGPDITKGLPPGKPLLIIDIGIPEQVSRSNLPPRVTVTGLDELTTFHEATRGTIHQPSSAKVDSLVDRALVEFRRFCHETSFSQILDTLQHKRRQLASETIPRLVQQRFSYMDPDLRARIELDLRAILLETTDEVFRSIREASSRQHPESWPGVS